MSDPEFDSSATPIRSLQRSQEESVETPPATAAADINRDPIDRVSCRAGDDSCAGAHASTINRSTGSHPARAGRSLLQLQRQYGNRYVDRVLSLAREDPGGGEVSPSIEDAIQEKRGGGQNLDSGVQRHMEGAFGANFNNVRVHTDTHSDDLNRSLNARAFTTGQDIFFRQGAYQPGSSTGRELIAHELTHVVQQDGDRVHRAMSVSQPGDPHEVEAEAAARAVMQREHAGTSGHEEKEEDKHLMASRDGIQRQPEAPKEDEEEKRKHHP